MENNSNEDKLVIYAGVDVGKVGKPIPSVSEGKVVKSGLYKKKNKSRNYSFKAYVTKQYLTGAYGIGEAGVEEWDEFVNVETISFNGDEVCLIVDTEGDEYSFVNNDLKTVISYTGFDDRNGTGVFDRDVLAAVIYDTNTLSSGTLRWEVFYSEEKMQYYVRDKAQDYEKPLAELRRSGIQYKVIGNTIEKPSLVLA